MFRHRAPKSLTSVCTKRLLARSLQLRKQNVNLEQFRRVVVDEQTDSLKLKLTVKLTA